MPGSGATESSGLSQLVEALVLRAARGDRGALGDALEELRPALWRLANDLLSADLQQKIAPSDLVQETCIDALVGFESSNVQSLKSLKAWLVTLLLYNVIDWQRKFKRSKKRDLRRERPLYDHESQLCLLHATLRDELLPDTQSMREEARHLLDLALQQLRPGYRQIIVWRNFKRLAWAKIGALINRSPAAARMLWRRAVARLKRELRKLA